MPNNISPISYTNKDFRSIYEELLNLAKELSYKWDPTISNESDPGVVLLKLNAIIGDKNNYNIDKNILEAFPETVTQETTARQLFNQLGYKMSWYKAATTDITFDWIGRDLVLGEVISIPKYTMITNEESNVVYSIIEEAQITSTTKGLNTTVKALQGRAVDYTVAGSKVITSTNFDKLNRLYLNDFNVAENGIFISNVLDKSIEWTLVDNIHVYPVGSYVYELNVDSRTNTCFLEFPEDFDSLIGSGITITYITTQGVNGNVKSRSLTTFLNDISVKLSGEDITLNNEVLEIYNGSSANNGSDPEDIEGAYRNYKKVVGTFDTLVTLRDYLNAVRNSELVSNGVVSDRLTDIQTTYSIITTNTDTLNSEVINEKLSTGSQIQYTKVYPSESGRIPIYKPNTYYRYDNTKHTISKINSDRGTLPPNGNIYVLSSTEEDDLTAYDLRMYLLRNTHQITNLKDYNSSFELLPSQSNEVSQVTSYLRDLQCVQHNFKDILKDRYCMFKTIYPLNIKVVPQYKLNETQITTLKNNVFEALRQLLNSKNVDFGCEPNYDLIYNTIEGADNRIKFVIVEDLSYVTYAVYWDGNKFKEIPISEFTADNVIFKPYSTLQQLARDEKYKNCYMIASDTPSEGSTNSYNKYDCFVVNNKTLEPYSNKIQQFRTEIIAKSVLAGVTSLFNVDSRFIYSLDKTPYNPNENIGSTIENINNISTYLVINPFVTGEPIKDMPEVAVPSDEIIKPNSKPPSTRSVETIKYTLRDNESLRFYGPSFKTSTSYSNYVKFMLILEEPTGFEYTLVNFNTDEPISIHQPVFLYEKDVNDGLYKYRQYTTNAKLSVTDTIMDLSKQGVLQVFRRKPSYQIPSGEDYQLRENDMLVLFWREKQDDDSPYSFKVYRGIDESKGAVDAKGNILKSPVINATFTLLATNKTEAPVSVEQLHIDGTNIDNGKVSHSLAANSPYQQISKLYGDNDLSGSKTIDIKEINQIVLKTGSEAPFYYFISKQKTVDNKYTLTLCHTNTRADNSPRFYILDEDEYFIQINHQKTGYEIYGPGTMISVNSPNDITLSVDAIDYSDILNDGLSALEKVCKIVEYDITVREQQLYTLTNGDTVNITLKEDYFETGKKEVVLTPKQKNPQSGLIYHQLDPFTLDNTIKVCEAKIIGESNSPTYETGESVYYSVQTVGKNSYILPKCVVKEFIGANIKSSNQESIINSNNLFKYCLIDNYTSYNIFSRKIQETYTSDENGKPVIKNLFVRKEKSSSVSYTFKQFTGTDDTNEVYIKVKPVFIKYNENEYDTSLAGRYYTYNSVTNKYTQCTFNKNPPTLESNTTYYIIQIPSTNYTKYIYSYNLNEERFEQATNLDVKNIDATGLYVIEYDNTDYIYHLYENGYTYYKVINNNGVKKYTLIDSLGLNNEYTKEEVICVTYSNIPDITSNSVDGLKVIDKYINNNDVYLISEVICAPPISNKLDNVDSYIITYEVAQETPAPIFTSDTYTNVNGLQISFTTSTNSNNLQSLPVTNVSYYSDGSWVSTARLDVQSSASKPQKLNTSTTKSSQIYYIHYSTEDGEKYIPYYVTDTNKNLYIGSNVDISKVGGSSIDTTYIDLLGNRHGVDLFIYQDNSEITVTDSIGTTYDYKEYININDIGNCNIRMDTNLTYEFPLSLDVGYQYLLPIQNTTKTGTFQITALDEEGNRIDSDYIIHPLWITNTSGELVPEEYGQGTFYFVLPANTKTLQIKIQNSDTNTLTLLPLIKYRHEELFNEKYGITVPQIIKVMKHFDKQNKFRYDYIVPEDKLIIDPLCGNSFFNNNHIYNSYTLPQCNLDTTRTTDLQRVLPNNSELIVVSNR